MPGGHRFVAVENSPGDLSKISWNQPEGRELDGRNCCLKDPFVIVSKHGSLAAALGVLAVAALVSAGSVLTGAADILHFDTSHDSLSPLSQGASQCWQWNAGAKDWTWMCRVGADRGAYPVSPFQTAAPVRYDYPSYGPGISGSSLAFVLGRSGREKLRPPAHAD